jgi:MFS transporter, PPP family, 3-phenylpropionic acid transporter
VLIAFFVRCKTILLLSLPAPLPLFFLTYFIFIATVNPYFSLWLAHHGYSASQIGVLLGIPPLMRVFGPTSWGRLADRSGRRAPWVRLMACCSLLGLVLVGLAPYAGEGRVVLAALGLVVMHAMLSGQVPLTESLLLSSLGCNTAGYGRVRLYGSVGFFVAVLVMGTLLDWTGIDVLLGLGAVVLVCHIAATMRLQDLAQDTKVVDTTQVNGLTLWKVLGLPNVALFLSVSFLMVFGHMALYIYFSLYLESVGYSKVIIGALWALSTVGEMAYFWWQKSLVGSVLDGYARCYWIGVARFGLLAWVAIPLGSPLWLLAVLQLLHASTFAVHHSASMAYVRQLFPSRAGSTANALFNTVTYGCAGVLGALACALIWPRLGAQGVFSLSALSCAVGGVLAWRLRLRLR